MTPLHRITLTACILCSGFATAAPDPDAANLFTVVPVAHGYDVHVVGFTARQHCDDQRRVEQTKHLFPDDEIYCRADTGSVWAGRRLLSGLLAFFMAGR